MRSAGQVSADLPRHISSWTPATCEQPRGSIEQEKEKEKEEAEAEYERRMQVLNWRVRDDIPLSPTEYAAWRRWSGLPPLSSSSAGKRRKRKKKRKRRLPRSQRAFLRGRSRRRQPQWHVSGSPGDILLHAVFPSVVNRHEMPCIMSGTRTTRSVAVA